MFAILKREFKAYFQSVIGWLFVAALLAIFGLYFYVYNLRSGYPYLSYTLSAITIVFLIAVPILTMRSFAEERKSRTDQLILTAPVSIGKLVLGKYMAMVAVFSIDVLLFALAPLILSIFGTIPLGECYVALLGFWLYGCACIAVGMFISALTESQVIAAVVSFAVLFVSYMMQGITGLISSDGNWITKILNCLDLYAPFDSFGSGCLDLTGIVYYVTVIALLNFLTVQSIQKRRWSMTKKNLSTGVFSTALIAIVLVLTVGLNLAVNAIPSTVTSIDCSYAKLYSITDQTRDYLKTLDEDVTIYAWVSESGKDVRIDEMLNCYHDLSKHIQIEYVNPSTKPYFYQDYTENAPSTNSLIVVSDERSKVIDYYDMYVYETSVDYSTYGYSNELTGFDAEGQITSAIEYVTMDADSLPVVYEITGHEEMSLGNAFEDVLTKANITLSSIELLNEDSVPEDAAAIIINSPQKDFNAADAKKVIDYLQNGGKAIITGIYAYADMENFSSILETYGVSITSGVIAENDSRHYYNWGGPFYLLPDVNSSDYTAGLVGTYVYIPASAGITYTEQENVTYISLMDTTEDSVLKNNAENMQSYAYEDGDEKGPFSVGLAVEAGADNGETTKLTVFGTPYIFSDEASQMTANNETLFADVITNLVEHTELASSVIPVKSYSLGNVTVPALYAVLLGFAVMMIVPVILIIVGIVIFAVRRKR